MGVLAGESCAGGERAVGDSMSFSPSKQKPTPKELDLARLVPGLNPDDYPLNTRSVQPQVEPISSFERIFGADEWCGAETMHSIRSTRKMKQRSAEANRRHKS